MNLFRTMPAAALLLVAWPSSAQAAVPGQQGIEIEGPMDRRGLFGGFGIAGGATFTDRNVAGFGRIDAIVGGGVTKRFTLGLDLFVAPYFQSRPAIGFGLDIEGSIYVTKGLFLRLGVGALGLSHAVRDADSGVTGGAGGKGGLGYEFFVNSHAALSAALTYEVRGIVGDGLQHGPQVGFRILWY